MEKKPQFSLDQLYVPIFGSKRVCQPDGSYTWEKISNQSAVTGIIVLDEFLRQVQASNRNMKSIALSAGINVQELAKFIKVLTGMHPYDFSRRYLLLRSVDLLRYTSLTCEKIAHQCGYMNVSNFSRSFFLYYKMRPLNYRYRCRKSGDLNRYRL